MRVMDFRPAIGGIKALKRLTRIFLWPIVYFIFLAFIFYLCFLMSLPNLGNPYRLFAILLILTYFATAHILIDSFASKLWNYIEPKRNPDKLTGALGVIDRIIYAICFAFQQYTFIGVWLGIKIATRLIEFKGVEITGNHKEDEKKIKPIGQRKNAYLLGNLASLVLGIAGGYLIIIVFNLPRPNFWK